MVGGKKGNVDIRIRYIFVALIDYCSVHRLSAAEAKAEISSGLPAPDSSCFTWQFDQVRWEIRNGINVYKTRLLKVHTAEGQLPVSQHLEKLSQVHVRRKIT